jgi:general secretion pathway protein K
MTRAAPTLPGSSASGRRSRRDQRGAALLVAIVAIAVLTALATDLAYQNQVRLRIAASARDQLRAEALAQSGVTLSRLVLGFQAQLDTVSQAMGQTLAAAAGAAGATAGQTGQTGAASAMPRLQLWNVVPVGSTLTDSLFPPTEGGGPATPAATEKPAEGTPALATAPLADFQGGYQAKIEDEGQKLNVQLDARDVSGVLGPQVEALLRLACDQRWDPLFDRLDAEGQRYSRTDLVDNLRDWVDQDNVTSALAVSFPAGNCSPVVPANPFEKGFGDENFPYDRGEDRYKTKNARMDSLDELHLVAGVSDAFMAAFGDQLTAYLPLEAKLNVNSSDAQQQLRMVQMLADPAAPAAWRDPAFMPAFQKLLLLTTMGGVLSITPAQFKQAVEAAGQKTKTLDVTAQNSPFTDRSVVYKIRASGRANDVTRSIEAVVTFDPNLNRTIDANGQIVQPPQGQLSTGRLIRWREE